MTLSLKNWHFMRLFRAGFAIWIATEAWRTTEWILLVPAAIFGIQAIFDIGCCGAAGCAPPQGDSRSYKRETEDTVTFEEIK